METLLGFARHPPMQLDPLDLVQRLGGEVALAAVRADHHGHVLDHQEVGPLAVAAGQIAYLGAALATEFADRPHGRILAVSY